MQETTPGPQSPLSEYESNSSDSGSNYEDEESMSDSVHSGSSSEIDDSDDDHDDHDDEPSAPSSTQATNKSQSVPGEPGPMVVHDPPGVNDELRRLSHDAVHLPSRHPSWRVAGPHPSHIHQYAQQREYTTSPKEQWETAKRRGSGEVSVNPSTHSAQLPRPQQPVIYPIRQLAPPSSSSFPGFQPIRADHNRASSGFKNEEESIHQEHQEHRSQAESHSPVQTQQFLPHHIYNRPRGHRSSSSISRLHEPEVLRQFPSICSIMASDPSQPGQARPTEYEDVAGRMATDMWKEEGTVCLIVRLRGIAVTRRCDNNMINGTKLLNSARISRGRRDGMLKAERIRHVVRVGGMDYKGVWVPFERALDMAKQENVLDMLYPLFLADLRQVFRIPENHSRLMQVTRGARLNSQFSMWINSINSDLGNRQGYHFYPNVLNPQSHHQFFHQPLTSLQGQPPNQQTHGRELKHEIELEGSQIDPQLHSRIYPPEFGLASNMMPGQIMQTPMAQYSEYLKQAYKNRHVKNADSEGKDQHFEDSEEEDYSDMDAGSE